jgi:NAD-reducing hydrogenase large subunit
MPKYTIEPVTRIEGHAKVTIYTDDAGKVDKALFHVNEWRGFEKFSEGRPFYEMTQITPRICGICPVSHHLASAKACDVIIGARPTRTANLLRELMHMGQIIQSHGMHFFELAGPDLLLGFDADPAIRNVAGIAMANPDLALKAIRLRAFGQEIIRMLGGKRVHPIFAVPGGVNAALTVENRDTILGQINEMIEIVKVGISLAKRWYDANSDTVNKFAVFASGYMGMVDAEGALQLYDGELRLVDRRGTKLEQFPASDYLDYIGEHVEPHTYLKFPFYRKIGWPDGTYRVGPLGRLNVAEKIATPIAQAEFKNYKSINGGKPIEGTLWYHYARLIETIYGLERVRQILEDPDVMSNDVVGEAQNPAREAVGAIEAPRGSLFHHFWVDENGLLTKVNLIVATGHNNAAMSKSVEMVAKAFIDGARPTEGMFNMVEAAIRAHDPCLSCSTHAAGTMPLMIRIVGPDGSVITEHSRG